MRSGPCHQPASVCEVTSVAEAEAALDAGSDGLIAVGHEAGGRVGADSAFILLQAILARTDRPVWIRGGIGPRVAAGCIAAGATGVVLEGAILLARSLPWARKPACGSASGTAASRF